MRRPTIVVCTAVLATAASLTSAAGPVGSAATAGGAEAEAVARTGPALVYSTFALGGSDEQRLAIGNDGSTYVAVAAVNQGTPPCGRPRTKGTFDTCAGQPVNALNGRGDDVLVAKYNPSGSTLVWATWLGGLSDDFPRGIAVDAAGNVYVAGSTGSAKFPTTAGAFDSTKNRLSDGFVAKIDPTGSQLLYSTVLGGSGNDVIRSLTIDDAGNAYVAGFTLSADFPTTARALDRKRNGRSDGFVAKLDPSGSRLLYSSLLGGSMEDTGEEIEIDRAGNAYVAGETTSTNFPATPGAAQKRCACGARPAQGGGRPSYDAFVAKLDPSGSRILYGTFLGGHSFDDVFDLAVDRDGNAYVAGETDSVDFPTTRGSFDTSPTAGIVSSPDGFVAKLNRTGTRVTYATLLGGCNDGRTAVNGIAIDRARNAWVTGFACSPFPTTKDAFRFGPPGKLGGISGGAFLTKLDRSGSRLAYSTYLGVAGGGRIGLDAGGGIYVAGSSAKDAFPTTPGAYRSAGKGRAFFEDGFLMKFSGAR